MKHKNLYQIGLAIALLILVLPACGSSNEETVISPTAQEVVLSEVPSVDEVEPVETEQEEEPEPTFEVLSTATVDPPRTDIGRFEVEGKIRNYVVFLPTNYNGTTNLPLVIYLHSYGWTAQKGMNYTSLNQVADTNDFIVVYPSGRSNWNSGVEDNPSWPTPDINDVGFINALIDTLSINYSIDLERIYATGYSNGGFMAYKLACQLSHRIAAIASVGGVMSTNIAAECNPLRPMPVLQIHGTEDTWVSINGDTGWQSVDQTLTYWIDFNNCVKVDTAILQDTDSTDGSTVEKISYTNCTNNSNVIYYEVINGGHTWPGAGPTGYSAGNTNQDFNASVEIWNFFKDYQLTPPSNDSNE